MPSFLLSDSICKALCDDKFRNEGRIHGGQGLDRCSGTGEGGCGYKG